jgi:hypothetical protein
MGRLHWPPDVVMAADVNMIVMALDAHTELLQAIHGSGKKPGDTKRGSRRRGVTADAFRAFARTHNGRIAEGGNDGGRGGISG